MNKRRTDTELTCPYRREGVCNRGCRGFQCLEQNPVNAPPAHTQVPDDRLEVRRIVSDLKTQLQWVEHLILRTPTGPRRDVLCDAGIHIRASIDQLSGLC